MNQAEYAKYLKSTTWASRRAKYYLFHPRSCTSCGRTTNIHLHHLTYERVGAELDGDLTSLCERCHSLVHDLQRKTGMDLADATSKVKEVGIRARETKKANRRRLQVIQWEKELKELRERRGRSTAKVKPRNPQVEPKIKVAGIRPSKATKIAMSRKGALSRQKVGKGGFIPRQLRENPGWDKMGVPVCRKEGSL